MLRWLFVMLAFAAGSVSLPSEVDETTQALSPGEVRSSWGKRLNPTGVIPSDGFRAFYFDRNDPTKVVFQEDVEGIAIKYALAEFHKIDSPNFGAYWVGMLNFASAETKQFSVSQSWAKSRIFIDGAVVFDGGNDGKTFTHSFTPGDHVVEVEFINNWHTVEYKVTIEDVVEKLDDVALASRLKSQDGKFGGVYYVGLYESSRKDTSVDVTISQTDGPIILWLTSYEAIDWNIVSLNPGSIVVVSSYAPGSRVRGPDIKQVYHSQGSRGLYGLSKQCSCVAGTFHCEGDQDLNDVAERLLSATGVPLSGYATEYSASALTVQPYDSALSLRISAQRDADRVARDQCVRKANPDFDKMMDDAQ
jgi:hypothetical protein